MRTKSLLAAAAVLAVGAASSMAQSNVYSLNVVGYVNVVVEGGGAYNLLANPLNNTTGNGLTNLFKTPGDYDQVFTWDVAAFDFSATQPLALSGAWDSNVNLGVGQGYFYVNANNTFTNTFVGEVVQGGFTNLITGSGAYNCIGSSAPVGGAFTNAIAGLVPADYDQIFKWDVVAFDFDATQPLYLGGWDSSVNINVGEGLFYVNANADQNWVRNFTVQ